MAIRTGRIRKTLALAIAYALGLQVLLASHALALQAAAPFASLCVASVRDTGDNQLPPHRSAIDCVLCTACSGPTPANAAVDADAVLAPAWTDAGRAGFATPVAAVQHERYSRQAPRGPPSA